MAITLRNKPVEELIRKIGARTGEGPSAVIARVVANEAARLEDELRLAAEKKLADLQAIRANVPRFTDEQRKEVWDELERINEEMFDDKDHDTSR